MKDDFYGKKQPFRSPWWLIGAAVLLLPALLSLTGADWLRNLSWAAALAEDGLSFRWSKLLWLAVWLAVCGIGTVLSEKRWRRERA